MSTPMAANKTLKTELLCEAATSLLSTYPKERKSAWRDIGSPMLTIVPLTVAKEWSWPPCSFTDEWIKELWYVCTMECYSAKDDVLCFSKQTLECFYHKGMLLEEKICLKTHTPYMSQSIARCLVNKVDFWLFVCFPVLAKNKFN